MSEKRSFNPLFLIVGVIAGAIGAFLMSDTKTRKKAGAALVRAKKKGTSVAVPLLEKLKKVASDAEIIHNQRGLDKDKKKVTKAKK